MGFSTLLSDMTDMFSSYTLPTVSAEAPEKADSSSSEKEDKDDSEEGEKSEDAGEGKDDAEEGEGEGEGDGEAEEPEEEEEEEEEDEPVDPKPALEEECARSAECSPYKHHFDDCVARVTEASENPEEDGEGKKAPKEDCVEEFFHLQHCATACAAPKLFKQLK